MSKNNSFLRSKAYKAWYDMKRRCLNESDPSYFLYGARGIGFCDRWNNFDFFLEDMGLPAPGTSLDRKNGLLGYFKENCRWADWKTQNNNTRRNVWIEWDGERKTLSSWIKDLGLSGSAYLKIKKGYSIEEVFGFKNRKRGRKKFAKKEVLEWMKKKKGQPIS